MDKSTIIAVSKDKLALRNLSRLVSAMNLTLELVESFEILLRTPQSPFAVVIEIEMEGALQAVETCAEKWPGTLIAGFVGMPSNEIWLAAEKAGCHLVATRGAIANQLKNKLSDWREHPGGRRFPLFSNNDIAGRLGLVKRITESPVGPLAIYHIGGQVFAIQDSCPHAGARLSEGELNMSNQVVTCPRHGSRFNIRNGDRLRGPADQKIKTYRVFAEGTNLFLQLD